MVSTLKQSLLFVLALTITPVIAHADTYATFALQNVTLETYPTVQQIYYNPTAAGTVLIDTTTGTVLSENVTVTEGTSHYLFTSITDQVSTTHDFYWDAYNTFGGFELSVHPNTLVGYTGGLLCSITAPCIDGPLQHAGNFVFPGGILTGSAGDFIHAGSLIPISTTPEPSSLALLATGALSLFRLKSREN